MSKPDLPKAAPLTPARLALANLKRKPYRSLCLVAMVAVFAFTLFGGTIVSANLQAGLGSLAARLGADMLIVPYGYESKLQGALLRGEPSQFYLKGDLAAKISHSPGVAKASPQLFIASLSSGCCSVKVQLVGLDPASDFTVLPWLNTYAPEHPLRDDEVIVGAKILYAVGEKVRFFNKPFTIAAKMDRTGMGFDSSVFMTLNAARTLMREANLKPGPAEGDGDYVSAIMVKAGEGYAVKDVANALMRDLSMDYNLDLVMATGMLSDMAASLDKLCAVAYALAGLLWLLAAAALFLAFSSSLNERKRELGLMRLLGASRTQLLRLMLMESMYIGLAGSVLGIFLASMVVFPYHALIISALGLPALPLSMADIVARGVLVLALTVPMGPLSCAWSALSLTRFDVYKTLREGE